MSSKITRWNDNDDRQLLLAIIQLTGVTPDWKEVGPMLGKTPEAVRQRFQKIKKETVAAGNGDTNTSSDPVTPVRKRAAKSQSGSTAKKHKGSKAGTSVQDEGDANTDDDEIRKNAEVIKKEEVVDDDDEV